MPQDHPSAHTRVSNRRHSPVMSFAAWPATLMLWGKRSIGKVVKGQAAHNQLCKLLAFCVPHSIKRRTLQQLCEAVNTSLKRRAEQTMGRQCECAALHNIMFTRPTFFILHKVCYVSEIGKKRPIYLFLTVKSFIKTLLSHTKHSCSLHIMPPRCINLLNPEQRSSQISLSSRLDWSETGNILGLWISSNNNRLMFSSLYSRWAPPVIHI